MRRFLILVLQDDAQTREHLAAIDSRRELARSLVPVGYERYIQRRAVSRSAHGSVSIEGNPLDHEAVQLAALDQRGEDPAQREARNADLAHRLMLRLADDRSLSVDVGLLRMFNSVLLDGLPGRAAEQAGSFRRGGSMIINTATGQFVYTGPPAEWVAELMQGLVQQIAVWVRDDPPEIAAAKAHFGLVSIHPFADGNGRTARLLADLILAQRGHHADAMLSLSSVLRERRSEYYETLQESQGSVFSERVDVTAFVRFHSAALADAVRGLEARAVVVRRCISSLTARFADLLDTRRIIGLLFLLEVGSVTTSQYAVVTDCSQPTALADLNDLSDAGLVTRSGRGRATRYELATMTRALMESA